MRKIKWIGWKGLKIQFKHLIIIQANNTWIMPVKNPIFGVLAKVAFAERWNK